MQRYTDELSADRGLLRDRLVASLDALAAQDEVDFSKLAAFGYCFGGNAVLDMARAGLPIVGGVSFHGVHDRPDYANVEPMAAKLLVCHGWDDPLGPPPAVVGLCTEMTAAKADWQFHAYGSAGHAFTYVAFAGMDLRMPGIGYCEKATAAAGRQRSISLKMSSATP